MGTSGVPWVVDKTVIVETLKARKGRLSYAAKDLNVHFSTLKNRIDADPELVQLLQDLRNGFDVLLVDSAEDLLLYAIAQKEKDLTNALKSSFYILNNKGRSRGYSPNKSGEGSGEGCDIRELAHSITECDTPIPPVEAIGKSSMENQSSLLDQECRGEETEI